MAPKVVLVGMPGSGKTSVGRALADLLGCGFVDADDAVVERAGRPIADIFAADGEAGFRAVEAATVAELLDCDDIVLSLGGGAVLAAPTRRRLGAGCQVVWLRVDVPTLVGRMGGGEADGRPLLGGDVEARLATLDRDRRDIYRAVATTTVDAAAGDPEQVAAAMLASLHATAPS